VKKTFLDYFPVPRFLKKPLVGIDLSDQVIKFAELGGSNIEGLSLRAIGRRELPQGVLAAGEIKNKEVLIQKLSEIKNEFGFEVVAVALPEEKSYFVKLRLPHMKKMDLRGSIELQLEEHVPVSPKELYFDYEILKEPENENGWYEIGVSSVIKAVVESYIEVFKKSGFKLFAFEVEPQSIGRALIERNDPKAYMILDIGKMRTGFTVISDDIVWFNATVPFGGDTITKAIEKGLNINYAEAEELKISIGFSSDPAAKQIYDALVPPLASLKDELKRRLIFWQTHKEEESGERKKIEKVILSGGQAGMPGLKAYLATSLGVEVVIANPWTNIFSFENIIPDMFQEEALTYAVALGLALRQYD